MKFIGIDLAWTYKNETGICILNEYGQVEFLNSAIYTDDEIISILKSLNNDILSIGIDAPLIVKNPDKSREAERMFMAHKINGYHLSVFHVSRKYLLKTYGTIRGEILLNKIIEHIPDSSPNQVPNDKTNTVTETFPSAICCGLFPEIYPVKYKIKPRIPYITTLENMKRLVNRLKNIEIKEKQITGFIKYNLIEGITNKKSYKHIEDQIDAFLCAYGLFQIYLQKAEALVFGDLENGFITVPVLKQE